MSKFFLSIILFAVSIEARPAAKSLNAARSCSDGDLNTLDGLTKS